ncbi:L,D-transpeptidase, partial [Micromonospora chalcea]
MLFDRFAARRPPGWLIAALAVPLLLVTALLVGRALTVTPARPSTPVVAAPTTTTAAPSPSPYL